MKNKTILFIIKKELFKSQYKRIQPRKIDPLNSWQLFLKHADLLSKATLQITIIQSTDNC